MKNIKSIALLISIALMVAVTTLVAAYTPINWTYFILVSFILAVLILLQKREIKKSLTENGNNELSLSKFEELLKIVFVKFDEVSKCEIDEKYLEKLLSIMDEQMPDIDEYRISMINQFGVANYTQISIPFAKAERLINRGVSAAIDGYLVESQKSILNSIEFLNLAIEEINKIKVGQNG